MFQVAKAKSDEAPRCGWSPYEDHGGTVMAIAGDDWVAVAADTRMTSSRVVMSRKAQRIFSLTKNALFAATGMKSDIEAFLKIIRTNIEKYVFETQNEPSFDALAQLISNNLYYHRMFPKYCFCILVGIDSEGKGRTVSYDVVGSPCMRPYTTTGSASQIALSYLDSQLRQDNLLNPLPPLTPERAVQILSTAYKASAQRDTLTGDDLVVKIIKSDGIVADSIFLCRD